jgi:hypothetical protein
VAERVEAKWVGKDSSLIPLLRTVAVATAGKTGAKWDFSPSIAAGSLLPRRLLDVFATVFFLTAPPGARNVPLHDMNLSKA